MKQQFKIIAAVLFAAAISALVVAQAGARNDPKATHVQFEPFQAIGYQASSSAPLVFHGNPIGSNAVWNVKVGPLESTPFATIPPASNPADFGGADCKADYSESEIDASDGSTLTVSVYGFLCEPSDPSATSATKTNPHFKSAVYSVLGGTGVFENVSGGDGSISFDAPGDGRVFVNITGFIECYPNGPIRSCKVQP